MDVITAVRDYINRMCSDVKGMKVLLLDAQTTGIMSIAYTQTEILQKEVFLVERLDKKGRERLPHLKALVFVRPTIEGIQALVEELRDPKYQEYHLFFNNIARVVHIERLAEADQRALVAQVFEYFADYFPINHDLFSLNLTPCVGDSLNSWDPMRFDRSSEGLLSLLLSLKKKPLIRYERSSEMCKRLANELNYIMQQESQLFDFRQPDSPPLLLILDRRNDPVTPLLNQWTYQAMIHELLGIRNNLVVTENKDLKEIVLSCDQDAFFEKNMYLNFGDLGANIKSFVEEYQAKTQSTKKLDSIADMKRFVEDYPQFKKLAGNVTKHVTLVSELSRLVDKEALLEVSELEQELAVNDDHASNLRNLQALLVSPNISHFNKIRLVLLYALRYEKSPSNEVTKLIDTLTAQGVDIKKISWISSLIRYAGSTQRQGDLFQNENIFTKGKSVLKKGLKGVENIYTQHVPLLVRTLEELLKGKLKETLYPYADTNFNKALHRPQDIVIFFVGGATYEEARCIYQLNQSTPGIRFLLGGTTIHNSASFLEEMEESIKKAK